MDGNRFFNGIIFRCNYTVPYFKYPGSICGFCIVCYHDYGDTFLYLVYRSMMFSVDSCQKTRNLNQIQ